MRTGGRSSSIPTHAAAHTNLGRLLHEVGEIGAAEAHYRQALVAEPNDVTASFNLAVVLEDRGAHRGRDRRLPARARHRRRYADAHYNLARLYERQGRGVVAVRHLRAYRRLVKGR